AIPTIHKEMFEQKTATIWCRILIVDYNIERAVDITVTVNRNNALQMPAGLFGLSVAPSTAFTESNYLS
ncbi:MAG: hypothetical protein AB2797_16460, partial [Candidatus Thiodiazotropha sp.]